MPTILREGPYRFFFYASDREEPPHVHVERDDRVAKFWLDPGEASEERWTEALRDRPDCEDNWGESNVARGGAA